MGCQELFFWQVFGKAIPPQFTPKYLLIAWFLMNCAFLFIKFMPYPGVPKEKEPKMDRCVKAVMKDVKDKSSAVAICKNSIMSMKEPEKKEEPYNVVANKVFTYFEKSKVNASKSGVLLKGIEIFKTGTYRGTEWKKGALDKMVSNFHYLKSMGIFPNVPVRANHPGMFSGGDIDQIGAYVADLNRIGSKLVADIRIVDEDMQEKIESGKYISRSAEIGTYDDNEGNEYFPTLFGFAWVDIPQVEGLSPSFSYSKGKENVEIINLNNEIMAEDRFPLGEVLDKLEVETPVVEAPVVETPVVEEEVKTKEEIPVVETPAVETPVVEEPKQDFSKTFPNEFAELEKLRVEKVSSFVTNLKKEGKILVAQETDMSKFAQSLTKEQFASFEEVMKVAPKVIELDKEIEVEQPTKPDEVVEKTSVEKAAEFLNETN